LTEKRTFVGGASIDFHSIIVAEILFSSGVQVIKVDMDDAASCKEALKDAYGVFLVTNYWEIFDANREIQQVCEGAFFICCAIECCANSRPVAWL
jgi:NmrA-like family